MPKKRKTRVVKGKQKKPAKAVALPVVQNLRWHQIHGSPLPVLQQLVDGEWKVVPTEIVVPTEVT